MERVNINPVHQITEKQAPYTFFHTHVLDDAVMRRVEESGSSVEIDISRTDEGDTYVGHLPTYYSGRNLPFPPPNLPLAEIVERAGRAGNFIVFDTKHIGALPEVVGHIRAHGSHRSLLHIFCEDLAFEPYPAEVMEFAEPHWPTENLPAAAAFAVKEATGVPVALSCRGLTTGVLVENEDDVLRRIISVAAGKADVVNFFLPGNSDTSQTPPSAYERLLENNIIPLVNIDQTAPPYRPQVFLGSSDHIENTTLTRIGSVAVN